MIPAAARLHEALVAEFARQSAGAPGAGLAAARLDEALRALLSRPFAEQRRTPGEVFREAIHAAGLSQVPLGDDVREAHLAWGVAKARTLTDPVVVYVGNDLMDRSKIAAAAGGAGLSLVAAAGRDALPENAVRAFVDLATPGADDAIRALREAGVTTIGFGPHVDDVALVRARALGADDALPRSVFFRRLPSLMPVRA